MSWRKKLIPAPSFIRQITDSGECEASIVLLRCIDTKSLAEACRVHSNITASGIEPPHLLSNRLINLLAKCGQLDNARRVFDEMLERDTCSWNTLIGGYCFPGDIDLARKLFDEMPSKDHFSWSTIMSGYTRCGRPFEALSLYRQLQKSSDKLRCDNRFTASCALTAAACLPCLKQGREIHAHIVRFAIDTDAVVWSSLCETYSKCGSIEFARRLFDKMPDRDVIAWTAMIGRYVEAGQFEEGLKLFSEMLRASVKPNEFTFAAVLDACSQQAVEGLGRQVHCHMIRLQDDPLPFAMSSLVKMYSNYGSLSKARVVFDRMPKPDLVSWTSMISAYAQNGYYQDALRYFKLMLQSGTRPDHVTFIGVLSGCTHAGLVDRGLEIFHSIRNEHNLDHTADHYACVVDLLSRAGRFQEVEEIMDTMPMKPNKFLWASLLNGCRIHKNLKLGEQAAEALFEIEPENAATYVTLANIYASVGMWNELERVRMIMDKRKVIKNAGSSWIEVKRKVHVFLAGDNSHPWIVEIHQILKKISSQMREDGYVPHTEFVLHDVEDEQKEENLSYHSEKLAVAYGVLACADSVLPIKVFKNLRICGDCHVFMKFVSRITKRKIIVRDSQRFHHFNSGQCSCRDYW